MRDAHLEPTSGEIIEEMEDVLQQEGHTIVVTRVMLTRWLAGTCYNAAEADPDNPPLSKEQLSEFRRVIRG